MAQRPTSSLLNKRTCPIDFTTMLSEEWLRVFKILSRDDQNVAISRLLQSLDAEQLTKVRTDLEPLLKRDFLGLLPVECSYKILSYLEAEDLLNCSRVCRNWRTLLQDNSIWFNVALDLGLDPDVVYGKNLGTQWFDPAKIQKPRPNTNYQILYMFQKMTERYWEKGCVHHPTVMRAHDEHVITCLEFDGKIIVTGSDDNSLIIWDVATGEIKHVLQGHTGGVWCSQLNSEKGILCSGSTDRTIRIWNIETGACKHVLSGHFSTVRCLYLHGNSLVSGSRDQTVRVWHISAGLCVKTLKGHNSAVRCVVFDGSLVVSGGYDSEIRVFNVNTEECLHVLKGHNNRVYSLVFRGKLVVSGSLDATIRVWDVITGQCIHTLYGHQSLTSGLEVRGDLLISANADSTVKIWHLKTGQCLRTLAGPDPHKSAVTALHVSRCHVVSSSDDGSVKLWNLQTGEFIRNLLELQSSNQGGVVWRIKATNTHLVCASGSRNGAEDTKVTVLDFSLPDSEKEFLSRVDRSGEAFLPEMPAFKSVEQCVQCSPDLEPPRVEEPMDQEAPLDLSNQNNNQPPQPPSAEGPPPPLL